MMGIILTDDALRRIEASERERLARLARQGDHFTSQRDDLSSGWIVRGSQYPGVIQIVNDRWHCTCRQFQVWDRCPHSAVVRLRHGPKSS